MRTLGVLGCLVGLSTAAANAQPAPPPPTASQPAASQDSPPPPLVPPGMATLAASPAPGPVTTEPEVVDYRWQVALSDLASIGLVFSGTKPGPTIGALVYVLGGPVIHGSNDEGGRTAISLGMRLGLPLIGAVGGAKLFGGGCHQDDNDCDDGALIGALYGFSLGVLSAMILDTALVARPHVAHKETRRTWAPQFTVTPQQKTVGVLASF